MKVNLDLLLLIQAVAAAVVSGLLVQFFNHDKKAFITHWIRGWTGLSAFLFLRAIDVSSAGSGFALTDVASLSIAALGGVAGYTSLAFFSFGSYQLARRRPVRLTHGRAVLMIASLFALGMTVTFQRKASWAGGDDLMLSALAGALFLTFGFSIWRSRRSEGRLGFRLVGVAMFCYGSAQLLAVMTLPDRYATEVMLTQLGLQIFLGLSMIIAILEDEREAAVMAASQIEHLAYHDALTGLPNRALFFDRLIISLAQATRAKRNAVVFFLDLDRFKNVNDSLGHATGDALLKAVAKRVRGYLREGDTVARFGGDEFALLLNSSADLVDTLRVAQKITDAIRAPFTIGERELVTTCSIGIAIFPHDGPDADSIVKNADTAMYRAKHQGRDGFQLYAPEMNSKALERLELESNLRKALQQEDLVIHYQPLINLATGELSGFEALVRWKHSDLGLLMPDHFIHTAEVSGLIVPLGEWVLRRTCIETRRLRSAYGMDLVASVNLSARQLSQHNLVDQVRQALRAANLPPQALELEITESSAMQNAEVSIGILHELKLLGVRLAIDDFGTGYSSLAYLHRFPIDTLKLDRSFVHDITAAGGGEIATAVIAMAHGLNLKVIAEGVETEAQLAFLKTRMCDTVQGYLCGVPLALEEFERFLRERMMARPALPMLLEGKEAAPRRPSGEILAVVVNPGRRLPSSH